MILQVIALDSKSCNLAHKIEQNAERCAVQEADLCHVLCVPVGAVRQAWPKP
jgi:hypothetical protein